jgi:hypothetical protein
MAALRVWLADVRARRQRAARRGSSKTEVCAHVRKLAKFPVLMAQAAAAAQPQPITATEELRIAA